MKIIVLLALIAVLAAILVVFNELREKKLLRKVTGPHRGTRSERALALKLLKLGIPPEMIFHDLYVRKTNGDFSQIDLAVVTRVGIIVFEVKDYSGWIYGNGYHSQWTQVLAYGREKYSFYNPIMQNSTHIAELRKRLCRSANVPIYSVIVFYGNCVLKNISFVPQGTYLVKWTRISNVMNVILKNAPTAFYPNIDEVVRVLREAVSNGDSPEIRIRHRERIRDMLGKERIFD